MTLDNYKKTIARQNRTLIEAIKRQTADQGIPAVCHR